jgi:5-bromo-4-chloroindolyl phosphate hydrolysis protein
MYTPWWYIGEYYDNCRSVVKAMENNRRLLRIIRENGLQVLSDDDQKYFCNNLNELREEVIEMNQFLSDVDFPKKDI